MGENKSFENKKSSASKKKRAQRKKKNSLNAPDYISDPKRKTPTMVNKAIQIDMDCEPGEDPKKNKKYYQDLAGLRGAREQYLELDIRDFGAQKLRQNDYINYLKSKLEMANKEIKVLKTKQCRCHEDQLKVDVFANKSFSSISL